MYTHTDEVVEQLHISWLSLQLFLVHIIRLQGRVVEDGREDQGGAVLITLITNHEHNAFRFASFSYLGCAVCVKTILGWHSDKDPVHIIGHLISLFLSCWVFTKSNEGLQRF